MDKFSEMIMYVFLIYNFFFYKLQLSSKTDLYSEIFNILKNTQICLQSSPCLHVRNSIITVKDM